MIEDLKKTVAIGLLSAVNVDNVMAMLHLADRCGAKRLKEHSKQILLEALPENESLQARFRAFVSQGTSDLCLELVMSRWVCLSCCVGSDSSISAVVERP